MEFNINKESLCTLKYMTYIKIYNVCRLFLIKSDDVMSSDFLTSKLLKGNLVQLFPTPNLTPKNTEHTHITLYY